MKVSISWKRAVPSLGVVREKTRIVLARNLEGIPFPSSRFFRPIFSEEVEKRITELLTTKGKQWGFISQHDKSGVLLFFRERRGLRLGVLVNEEDHLRLFSERMSALRHSDFESVRRLDRWLEQFLDYAFDPQWGYLVSSSQWMGTGLRVFLWLHLPALSLVYGEGQVLQWFQEHQEFVVSGYGGSREPLAHVFEVTNRHTLGVTEKEIFERMSWVERKVVRWERSVRDILRGSAFHRKTLLEKVQETGENLVQENDVKNKRVLDLLSLLRFGQEEGIFAQGRGCSRMSIGELVEKNLKTIPLRGACEDILELLGVSLGRIQDDV